MSRYAFQFFVLLSVAVLFTLWQRNRTTPAPIRNGFYVVRWPLTMRIVNAAFFICAVDVWLFPVLELCGRRKNTRPALGPCYLAAVTSLLGSAHMAGAERI
jgi:hypothetical protein